MSVSPGRSRIADLTFHVFRRPLHPDWFMTKAFRRVEHRGWGADLRIIEGGHAVLFRSGPVVPRRDPLAAPRPSCPNRAFYFTAISATSGPPTSPGWPDRIPELRQRRAGQPRDLPAPLRGDDPRRGARRPLPPLPIGQPPGTATDQPSPRRRPGQHAGDPRVSHLPRRMRDRPHPIPVRAETFLIEALSLTSVWHGVACRLAGVRGTAGQMRTPAAKPAAIRRFVAVPTVGRSLRRAAADSPRRCWESASRHVDKTCVGPSRLGPSAGPSPTRRSVRSRPAPCPSPTPPVAACRNPCGVHMDIRRAKRLRSGARGREKMMKVPKKYARGRR